MTSNHHILESISILGWVFGQFLLLQIAFTFGSHGHIWQITWSDHKKHMTSHSLHLSLMKQKPTGRVSLDAKSVAWICLNSCYSRSYKVTKTLWRRSFSVTRISTNSCYRFCFSIHSTLWRWLQRRREPKIRRLKLICRNHFVVKGLPP